MDISQPSAPPPVFRSELPPSAGDAPKGWRAPRGEPSLTGMFASIRVAQNGSFWRKLAAFLGPGYLVATGYMDPGNWATSLAGGSKFGYALLAVALLSNLMAIVLQALCARLGVGSGRDLAQACRDAFPRAVSFPLWLLAEIAICATDLAEVIGTAIGAVWLVRTGGSSATLWLGVALVVYALLGLFKVEFKVPPAREKSIGFVSGIVTGMITAGTGVFAIPMVPYLQGLGLDRHRLVQALGPCFTICTIALAGALGHAGEIHPEVLWPSLAGVLAVLAGMRLGQLLRGRIRPAIFRLCFFAGLLILGGHLALRSIL